MFYREELLDHQKTYKDKHKVQMTAMNFLDNTTFPPSMDFAGKKEQFDEFCYTLCAYLNLITPGYNQIF